MDLAWVYFLLMLQGLALAARKATDWKWGPYTLQHRLIYLPGVIAGLALAVCGHLLWVSTGADPDYSPATIRAYLRMAFLLFTLMGLLFDVAYLLERVLMVRRKK